MKIIVGVLLSVSFVLCEYPPPYLPRGFRPSPPLLLPFQSQPQTNYGPPKSTAFQQNASARPQTQYGAPNIKNVEPLEHSFGSTVNPAKLNQNFNSQQTVPQNGYGAPSKFSSNNFEVTNNRPQTTYGAPGNQNIPQAQYGAPNTKNIETLEQIRLINFLLQSRQSSKLSQSNRAPPTKQYLPVREAANFRSQINLNEHFARQFLPLKEAGNFRKSYYQGQNQNFNFQQPTEQYLPLKEAANFKKGYQSNQNQFSNQNNGASPSYPNIRNNDASVPSSQYLPASSQNYVSNQNQWNDQGNMYRQQNIPSEQNVQYNNIAIPSTQYTPTQSNVNLRNNVDNPSNQNFVPQNSASNYPSIQDSNNLSRSPNQVPSSQYIPTQNNGQNSNTPIYPPIEDGNSQARNPNLAPTNNVPSSQYLPTQTDRPNDIDVRFNPHNQNFAPNFQTNNLNNRPSDPNNFGQSRPGINLDFEQANVRALNPTNRNTNGQAGEGGPASHQNGNFGENPVGSPDREVLNNNYVPSTTTRPLLKKFPRPTQRSVSTPKPTEAPTDENESTESDEESANPNVAIATAVAGGPGGQQFYLIQPDGRFQKVIYQKTTEDGDQENEYTANYYFQNIQADPNVVYTPIVNLA